MNDDLLGLLSRAFCGILAGILLIAVYFYGTHKKDNFRTRRGLRTILLLALGVISLFLALFFPDWLRHINGPTIAIGCLITYLSLVLLVIRKSTETAAETRIRNTHFVFKSVEITILVLGILFALYEASHAIEALKQNTQSNKLAGRGQLYQADNLLTSREYTESNGKLSSLYADADPKCKDAKEAQKYVSDLLSLVTTDSEVKEEKNVDDLYERMFGIKSFSRFDPSNARNENANFVELRRMSQHCIQILDLVHSAYDYCGEGVISEQEFETWAGYLADIGPHPVFLATVRNWELKPYMSRGFGRYLHYRIYQNAKPGTKLVVEQFYPDLARSDYGNDLPEYGIDLLDLITNKGIRK
jgi:hypothetical protein